MQKYIEDEVRVHSDLDHPGIIKLLGYFQEDEYMVIMLEYAAHGELYSHIKHGNISEKRAAQIVL